MKKNNKINRLAFTLAEVLIVIGIIGIIADMTIPTLQKNTQKQTQIVGVKKMYTDMTQAVRMMMADEGVSDMLSTSYVGGDPNLAGNFLKKYFNVIRDCGTTFPSPCMGTGYRNINKALINDAYGGYCVVTSGGATICMQPTETDRPAHVMFDTNGAKKPNVAGRDLFYFNIYDNGSIDEVGPTVGNKYQARMMLFYNKCNSAGEYGAGCFAKILNDGWVMDY